MTHKQNGNSRDEFAGIQRLIVDGRILENLGMKAGRHIRWGLPKLRKRDLESWKQLRSCLKLGLVGIEDPALGSLWLKSDWTFVETASRQEIRKILAYGCSSGGFLIDYKFS